METTTDPCSNATAELMARFNEVYRSFFKDALPVRSTVEAKLSQGVDIEIEVTAWAPRKDKE